MVVITTQGVCWFGQVLLGQAGFATWIVHLYVNLWTPTTEDTIATYRECTWPGYSAVTLEPVQWVGTCVRGVATFNYPLITFNFDPAPNPQQTIFGYYVTTSSGVLLYAEAFSAPFPIPPDGGEIPLLLVWTDEQCR